MNRRWVVLGGLFAALVLGVALIVVGGDDGGGDGDGDGGRGTLSTTSTTLATGGLEIDAPDGWQEVPLPSLGFGIAVPPGWQATRTDDAALDALEERNLDTPGFVDAARNAAAAGAVLYAALLGDDGSVSDVKVQVLPRPGATSAVELRELADGIIDQQGISVEARQEGDDELAFTFDSEQDGIAFRVTQVLRAGDESVVSLIVTTEADSTPRADHTALTAAIARTLVLP